MNALTTLMTTQTAIVTIVGMVIVAYQWRQYRLQALVCARPYPEHRSLERCSVD